MSRRIVRVNPVEKLCALKKNVSVFQYPPIPRRILFGVRTLTRVCCDAFFEQSNNAILEPVCVMLIRRGATIPSIDGGNVRKQRFQIARPHCVGVRTLRRRGGAFKTSKASVPTAMSARGIKSAVIVERCSRPHRLRTLRRRGCETFNQVCKFGAIFTGEKRLAFVEIFVSASKITEPLVYRLRLTRCALGLRGCTVRTISHRCCVVIHAASVVPANDPVAYRLTRCALGLRGGVLPSTIERFFSCV